MPTDQHEADGTFAWDTTDLVTVELCAGDTVGLGYTYAPRAVAMLLSDVLVPIVIGQSPNDLPRLWE
ncbi:MAG: hypothetical protein KDD69_19310, partial [Bdellovibrionales bacterium]|nr:hypothetical protein [Bdellovibrionales bacterium]